MVCEVLMDRDIEGLYFKWLKKFSSLKNMKKIIHNSRRIFLLGAPLWAWCCYQFGCTCCVQGVSFGSL